MTAEPSQAGCNFKHGPDAPNPCPAHWPRSYATNAAKHSRGRMLPTVGTFAQHNHDVSEMAAWPLGDVLSCPRCNPSAYATQYATHRRKARP